ncbi:threonine-phosphate decarboxylase [Phocaeicola sartorii]|uniref:Aminotransferase n=1 Tax=Phocaeicola sartorii TaxID=671267 RepID=R9I8F5_9BACT|nr:threonine-phosphate decarboxylase [Phocaeicola sartorii]EOS12420.1 threonine-phosphate decarboxylase [Phocaeicola sartorii]MCR1843643.1 pyridoxal phosphate-dependent class II aminotransferase [Phocaeicola sartorii]NUK99462.1 pyridoxal phosphate-dependent class II aminotransferase [Phocaeicola sartorii]
MIEGHGDDAYKYKAIKINFSSNVYNHVDHSGLYQYLSRQMESIRTYPEPEPYSLEKVLAERFRLSSEEVCVTNGATEAIYLIAQTFRNQTSAILMPTFSEYADACRLHGHKVVPIYNLNRLPDRGRLIWLCNPNNPTGEVREKEALTACIKQNRQRIFIIDQSYEFFTQKALLTARKAAEFPNVILLHSMTKRFAVPGLRLGYITACKELLHEIRTQRMPWSVNQLAIEAGHYLLSSSQCDIDIPLLLKEKERLAQSLLSIGGMEIWPSDTHYMLVQLRMGKAAALKEYLATEQGILIRDASNFEGLNEHFFRIATQTPEENDKLVESIKKWTYMY